MKKLFVAANQYLKGCTWKDMALLKICVCAMGVLIGLAVVGPVFGPFGRGLGGVAGFRGVVCAFDGQVFALSAGRQNRH